MAKGINKVFLLGNVGREPEIRATHSGGLVASFSVATADRQKDQAGQWKDVTEWHNVVAFGRLAEVVRDHVKKGQHLHVEGKLQTRAWDGKDGQKKYRTEILAGDVVLLGGEPQRSTRTDVRASTQPAARQSTPQDNYGGLGITDDDIPF